MLGKKTRTPLPPLTLLSSHLEQVSEQIVTLVLGVNKDDDLANLVPLPEDLKQTQEPVLFGSDLDKLGNVCINNAAATDLRRSRYRR
jgi:hypothetical protein